MCLARKRQEERFKDKKIRLNSEMGKKETEEYCILSEEAEQILQVIFRKNEFSTRRYYRILRLARTIADLGDEEIIQKRHLTEAFGYCNIGKKYWRSNADEE